MAEEDWTIVNKVNSNKWQEEEDDDDIKDNWDDDDDDNNEQNNDDDNSKSSSTGGGGTGQQSQSTNDKKSTTTATTTSKKNKKLKDKIRQKEMEQLEQLAKKPKTPEELLAEKLRQQQLIADNDLALAKETFGISGENDTANILQSIRLATKDDFNDLSKALNDKLQPFVKSPHYLTFLDNLFRSLASSLDSDDIRKLNTTLTALYNEKIKLQKQEKKGKKSNKKATIIMERDSDYSYGNTYDDQYGDDYDDFI